MSVDIQVVPLRDILHTNLAGEFDFDLSRLVAREIAEACDTRPHHHVLLDAREATSPSLGPTDLFNLVKILEDLGIGVLNRLAILYRPRDEIDHARLFALCAAEQGLHVAAFREFEAAIDWLGAAD